MLFVREQFGVEPDPWQVEALRAFADPAKRRISLQACIGPGKTAVLAWCAWNFLACHGPEPSDYPRGVAVSIDATNLADNLWTELALWQGKSQLLSDRFTWTQTRVFANEAPGKWYLSARTWPKTATPDEQGKTLSGLHGKYILALIDESGAIPPTVLRAAEQALSNVVFGKIVQAGNPISLEGMLAAAATQLRHQWHVIEITGDPDVPTSWVNGPRAMAKHTGLPDCGCARCQNLTQIQTYGRENPWVMSQILGQFPPSSLNALLGPDDVREAMARQLPPEAYNWAQARVATDVARFGDDRTCLFTRQGSRAYPPIVMRHVRDSAVSTDIATAVLREQVKYAATTTIFDATGGWAAGARDVLVASGQAPVSIQFHLPSANPRYKNRRAEMWFAMAEWVKSGGWLPNVPELIAELVTPTYSFVNGKFQIEEKDQVKKRLGRSPDLADALALTFGVPDVVNEPQRYVERYRPASRWG